MDLWYCEKEIENADRMIEQWKAEIGEGFDVNFMRYELLSESLKHIQREDECTLDNDLEECDDEEWDEECEEYDYDASQQDCATPISPAAVSAYFSFVSECSDDDEEEGEDDEEYSDDDDDDDEVTEEDYEEDCDNDNVSSSESEEMDTFNVICDQTCTFKFEYSSTADSTLSEKDHHCEQQQLDDSTNVKTMQDFIHHEYIGGLLHELGGPCVTRSNANAEYDSIEDHSENEQPSTNCDILDENETCLNEQSLLNEHSSTVRDNKQAADFNNNETF
ncbi:hypothetical protein C9374_001845 [Naegleria lovaniensis]|uniref:Uncharacterized protein n=1 Tax=Naegleria lovaniensis TaxID=51637 RepID=A0AA88GQ12_NAELO|nr:uncharacterized protein C9374_001845 [Naegleria lovaniensis]KAG2386810.1 hypothetical protein C9374_001845 [Naegleria lovaniensis]